MPSARTPSRVTMPCRSSSSSASARRSGVPANRRSVGDQRPCVAVTRGRAAAGEAARPPLGLRHAVAARRAQRLPGVVRHLAGPDEVPERGSSLVALEPGRLQQVEPELAPTARARRGSVVGRRTSGCSAAPPDAREPRRPRGSTRPRGRARRRSRRPRRSRRAGRAARAGSPARGAAAPPTPTATPAAPAPAAGRAPRAGRRAGRRRARRGGSGRRRSARPARPPSAARRARRAAAGAGRRDRTTRARSRPAGARRGRAAPPRSSACELPLGASPASIPKRAAASAVVNGPRPRANRASSVRSGSSPDSRNASGSPDGGIAPSASR